MTLPLTARSSNSTASATDEQARKTSVAVSAALSSGFTSDIGRAVEHAGIGTFRALNASRRQREQQDALLQRAEQELLKVARKAQAALERRVGGAPDIQQTLAVSTPAAHAASDTSPSWSDISQPSRPRQQKTQQTTTRKSLPRAVRPACRGAVPKLQRASQADSEVCDQQAPSGQVDAVSASASLRAAAALSPQRGFCPYSPAPSSPRHHNTPLSSSGGRSGRLSWPSPALSPGSDLRSADEEMQLDEELNASQDTISSSASWKRSEKTVHQYVSRRNVGLSEYTQVCQRYEGHLNELKLLCETVGRHAAASHPITPSATLDNRSARHVRELRDEKDTRDAAVIVKASRARSCSPVAQPPKVPGWAFVNNPTPQWAQTTSPLRTRATSPPPQRLQSPRRECGRALRDSQVFGGRASFGFQSAAVEAAPTLEPSAAALLLGTGALSDVPLPRGCGKEEEEANDLDHVRALFCAQVPEASVLGVFRVENQTLAGVYSAVRESMDTDCELDLWHGTSVECVPNIVLNGFNRAYSGRRHGTRLGHGSYFSASAAYSIKFCDRKRVRRSVFFSKVLVGAWTKGSPDLVEPPHRDKDGLSRYDSTVDDPEHPVNFCIFRDFQALPTYLVEFSMPS
eukprot:TRINITY_DN107838_c0_g1_i1.p1 TRINITY_DN107838_c0_g1~~TRINITY_DN107838_c0_g1_i1.p1  ORF type:complete len:630 (-),score=91.00 TRINITY_DN107838_c0_g1_i1:260-2149(-)